MERHPRRTSRIRSSIASAHHHLSSVAPRLLTLLALHQHTYRRPNSSVRSQARMQYPMHVCRALRYAAVGRHILIGTRGVSYPISSLSLVSTSFCNSLQSSPVQSSPSRPRTQAANVYTPPNPAKQLRGRPSPAPQPAAASLGDLQ